MLRRMISWSPIRMRGHWQPPPPFRLLFFMMPNGFGVWAPLAGAKCVHLFMVIPSILPLFPFNRTKIRTTNKVVFDSPATSLLQNQIKNDNGSRLWFSHSSPSPESIQERQTKSSLILLLLPFHRIKIRMITKMVFHPPAHPLPQNQIRTTTKVFFDSPGPPLPQNRI
jgi:hypothetical protein